MKCNVLYPILCISLVAWPPIVTKRSPLRAQQGIPSITVCFAGQQQQYTLTDSHLEPMTFASFDTKFFYDNILPDQQITYRNNQHASVDGQTLSDLANSLIPEIMQRKKKFTHFIPLKMRDFSVRDRSGLVIMQYKEYPFVLKLFIENPFGFTHPFAKGFEPSVFFIMGGGVMRHMTGFTRIKNLKNIQEKLKSNPDWAERIDLPRKWFWLPNDPQWLEVTTVNVACQPPSWTISIPAIYGIICDKIDIERQYELSNSAHRRECIELCSYLEYVIDPHMKNYVLEKGTHKLVLFDTEHFPTMVGLKEKFEVDSYLSWYGKLALKLFKDKFCRTKSTRKKYARGLMSYYQL